MKKKNRSNRKKGSKKGKRGKGKKKNKKESKEVKKSLNFSVVVCHFLVFIPIAGQAIKKKKNG